MDFLYQTIGLMKKGERLHFRRQYKNGIPQSIKMYDSIVKSDSLHEQELNKKIIKQFGAQTNYLKHKLHDLLLHSITNYSAKKNMQIRVLHEIAIIKTLRHKKQGVLAKRRLEKVFKECIKLEEYNLIELLSQEKFKLELYENLELKTKDYTNLIEFSKAHAHKYTQLLKLRILYDELIFLKKKSGFVSLYKKVEYQKIAREFKKFEAPKGDEAQEYILLFDKSSALIKAFEGKLAEAQLLMKNVLERILKAKHFIDDNNEFLLDGIQFYRTLVFSTKDYTEVDWLIDYVDEVKVIYKNAKLQLDIINFLIRNRYYNKTVQYNKADRLMSSSEDLLELWLASSHSELESILIGSISISYFIQRQYEDSYFFINRLIKSMKNNLRHDIISFANLFAVIVSFELKNDVRFDSQVTNSINHFKKYTKSGGGVLTILNSLQKAYHQKSFKNQKSIYEKLMPLMKVDETDEIQQMLFGYFDFKAYFESKLNRLSYREYRESNQENG